MKTRILATIGVLLLPAAAQAAPPSELLGKSVLISWTEHRTQRRVDLPHVRQVAIPIRMAIYISSAGNTFRRLSSTAPTGQSGSRDEVGNTGRTGVGGPTEVDFQGRSMISMAAHGAGARRAIVDFDETFASCKARVTLAKEAGSAGPIRIKSAATGHMIEVHSVSIAGASCSIRSGNVFGG